MDMGTAIFLMVIVGVAGWRFHALLADSRKTVPGTNSSPTPPPATPAPAPAAASPATGAAHSVLAWSKAHPRLLLTTLGIIALVVLAVLFWPTKWPDVTVDMPSDMKSLWLIPVGIVVLILFWKGLQENAHGAARLVVWLVALSVIGYGVLYYTYGNHTQDVLQAAHDRNHQKVLQSLERRSRSQNEMMETSLALTTEWSKPIRIAGHQCIRWWGADPDGTMFTVEVRSVNDTTWKSWDEWQKLRAAGTVTNPGWVRFRATEAPTQASYQVGKKGECS